MNPLNFYQTIMKEHTLKAIRSVLVSTAVGLALVSTSNASLLVNGTFEDPVQQNNGSQFLPTGTTIPGWTVVGNGTVNVDQTFSPTPFWPGNGSQFMDLTGNSGNAGVQSDAFATVIGQTYEISFDSYNGSLVYPGAPQYLGDAFSVQATGGSLVIFTGAQNASLNTVVLHYLFTATSTSSSVTFMDLSGYDSNAGWIDNVSLSAVPEPTTVIAALLLLLPFGASAARIVRARKALLA